MTPSSRNPDPDGRPIPAMALMRVLDVLVDFWNKLMDLLQETFTALAPVFEAIASIQNPDAMTVRFGRDGG
jgi:hypothetical protein